MSPRGARPLRIGCLAWGSLVWKAGPLALVGDWRAGGPALPIEFCRAGDGGELATAIWPGTPRVPTRWALLETGDLLEARDQLRRREAIDARDVDRIGDAPFGNRSLPLADDIAAWADAQRLDHVVWTALAPRFAGQEGRAPTLDEAVGYLDRLQGAVRDHAEHYVRSVPADIRTAYRAAFEARLGWTPAPAA